VGSQGPEESYSVVVAVIVHREGKESVDDHGDLPSRKRYGKARENG